MNATAETEAQPRCCLNGVMEIYMMTTWASTTSDKQSLILGAKFRNQYSANIYHNEMRRGYSPIHLCGEGEYLNNKKLEE